MSTSIPAGNGSSSGCAQPYHHTNILCSDRNRLGVRFTSGTNAITLAKIMADGVGASCIMEKHGMIHGDINLLNMHWYPDNVAENGDGYGVLVDFDMRCGAAWDFPQRTKEREREEAEKEELEERGRRYDEIRRQTEHDMAVD